MGFPSVNIGAYSKMLDQASTVQRMMCGYCGNENIASGEFWICFHCENVNRSTMLLIKLNDTQLMSTFALVNEKIASNDYEGAIAAYNSVIQKYNEPEAVYNLGLIYLQYSNYHITQIRYDRKGFMEENAIHRETASSLASKAKLMMNEASSQCQNFMKTRGVNEYLVYSNFIINIKLGRIRSATKSLAILKSFGNVYLINYAGMLLGAESKDYELVAKCAIALLQKGQFSVNAFYYLSWAMFKDGKKAESLALLGALAKHAQGNNVVALTNEIRKSMEF